MITIAPSGHNLDRYDEVLFGLPPHIDLAQWVPPLKGFPGTFFYGPSTEIFKKKAFLRSILIPIFVLFHRVNF